MTTKNNKAENRPPLWCAVILDQSGSMEGNTKQTINGFNEFLQDRKRDAAEVDVKLWLTKFNTRKEVVHAGTDVRNVQPLNKETYCPTGGTALLDAVAATVYSMEAAAEQSDENPRLLVLIITDGEENASIEMTSAGLKNMITAREKTEKWAFKYIGANVDAFNNAAALGMKSRGLGTMNASLDVGLRGISKYATACTTQPASYSMAQTQNAIDRKMDTLNITLADELDNIAVEDLVDKI